MAGPCAFFQMADVVLRGASGRLEVHLLRYGMTVHAIRVRHGDAEYDVLAGPADPATHRTHRAFYGPLIGRYANRLPAGPLRTDEVAIDAQPWGMWHTDTGGDGISHHGGPPPAAAPHDALEQAGPLDTALWTVEPAPQFFGPEDWASLESHVVMALESPAGNQGYPGRVRIEALTGVARDACRIHVAYRARLVDACAATPLNLTQHWGFHVRPAHTVQGDAHLVQHRLALELPHRRLALDARGVPTGALEACDTAHDWTQAKALGQQAPAGGYDHFYVWGPPTRQPVARLTSPEGIALAFSTNQAGVQLYVAREGTDDAEGDVRAAAFLEFSAPHATFLHAPLQQAAGTDTVLRAGETYENWVDIDIAAAEA